MKVRYYHDTIGVNSRLDTIQAGILRVKLRHLDAFNEARQKAAAHYDRELSEVKGITIPLRAANSSHIFHQYTLRVEGGERNRLRECLENEGVPSMIYYPVPVHKQKPFKSYSNRKFPESEKAAKQVISLPVHPSLTKKDLGKIIKFLTREN